VKNLATLLPTILLCATKDWAKKNRHLLCAEINAFEKKAGTGAKKSEEGDIEYKS
jgi:hypothetical protein